MSKLEVECLPLFAKAQLFISIGQSLTERKRYLAKLKEKKIEQPWLTAFETRINFLEEFQRKIYETIECPEENQK